MFLTVLSSLHFLLHLIDRIEPWSPSTTLLMCSFSPWIWPWVPQSMPYSSRIRSRSRINSRKIMSWSSPWVEGPYGSPPLAQVYSYPLDLNSDTWNLRFLFNTFSRFWTPKSHTRVLKTYAGIHSMSNPDTDVFLLSEAQWHWSSVHTPIWIWESGKKGTTWTIL